ncbi:MAG TPA: hybrid sensor histidine kinase/response regulator, partial [Polyangiaceae bacterium]|nr:hybrid sensor histidine kinase/response regulator [Polyangiaceae bacterium]
SGREVAVELRAQREDIRVLFISGYSPEAADLQTLLADGENFLQKPFEPERLMGQIRGLLGD